jgi:hypothetical protein
MDMNELISKYTDCALECERSTRVFTNLLQKQGIPRTCMVGTLAYSNTNEGAQVHFLDYSSWLAAHR